MNTASAQEQLGKSSRGESPFDGALLQNFHALVDLAYRKTGALVELYAEDRLENEVNLSSGDLTPLVTRRERGIGLRLLHQGKETYGYTNILTPQGLEQLLNEVTTLYLWGNNPQNIPYAPLVWHPKTVPSPASCLTAPEDVDGARRRSLLRHAEAFLASPLTEHSGNGIELGLVGNGHDPAVVEPEAFLRQGTLLTHLALRLSDETRRVLVVTSEGLENTDTRTYTRLRANYQLENLRLGQQSAEWKELVAAGGYEMFDTDKGLGNLRREMTESAAMLTAAASMNGYLPVVFAAGSGGTLFHECCGHQLEASAVAGGRSDFAGLLGQAVASEKVTLVDDATLPGAYGSEGMDDEGHLSQKNILINKGILKNYLCDRLQGERLGLGSNGCGRRQNYTFRPTSRMSNTFLAAGECTPEAIVKSIPEGLYVSHLGGGSGGSVFSTPAVGAYRISQGEIREPVKPCMLSDRGKELLFKVDMVGNDLQIESGSLCGAASGLVPVTASCPTFRVKEMKLGNG